MSYHLSLDETAESDDETFEAYGFKFVIDTWSKRFLAGLTIDVLDLWGQERLVADNPALGGGCY